MSNRVVCYAHPDSPLIEDYRAGDMICSECGLVVGDRVIDVGSEWRTFSNEKSGVDPSRVGGPENPLLSGGDLSTMIGPGTGPASFDAFGSKLYFELEPKTILIPWLWFDSFVFSCQISKSSNHEQLRPGTHCCIQGNFNNGRSDKFTKNHRRSGQQFIQTGARWQKSEGSFEWCQSVGLFVHCMPTGGCAAHVQGNLRGQQNQQEGNRPLLQIDIESTSYICRSHYHRRFHESFLRQFE